MSPEYINANEPVYRYLVSYFLPELSDPKFRQASVLEIAQDECMTYCRHMAAWLLHEKHYNRILEKLSSLSTERSTRPPASASSFYSASLRV